MPICPTIGREGKGIDALFDMVVKIYEQSEPSLSRHIHINHGKEIEKAIEYLQTLIKENQAIRTRYSTRYLAIKYLERDKDIERVVEALPNRDSIIAARLDEDRRIESLMHSNIESSIVDAKYAFIQGALAETFTPHIEEKPKKKLTD